MKKLLIIIFCFCVVKVSAQEFDAGIVFNSKLFFQISKNQFVRTGSENLFRKNYQYQRETYEKINADIAKVLAVEKFIHSNLTNVNKLLKDGKKMKYFVHYINEIRKNVGTLLSGVGHNLGDSFFQYRYFLNLSSQATSLYNEVYQVILKEDKSFLLDAYDRELFVEKLLFKAKMLNAQILYLINLLETSKEICYLKKIPVLKDYISLDKTLVSHIMNQWKTLKY